MSIATIAAVVSHNIHLFPSFRQTASSGGTAARTVKKVFAAHRERILQRLLVQNAFGVSFADGQVRERKKLARQKSTKGLQTHSIIRAHSGQLLMNIPLRHRINARWFRHVTSTSVFERSIEELQAGTRQYQAAQEAVRLAETGDATGGNSFSAASARGRSFGVA
eukprot:6182174-Pleurochrysis_carterae.AAC.4